MAVGNSSDWYAWKATDIQLFEQVARYFSHAHLYLNGTSWLTSVLPLMMRLSAALTRRAIGGVTEPELAGTSRNGAEGTAATTGDEMAVRVAEAVLCAGLAV